MSERKGYAEIAANYRQQIEDGRLKPGDTMPSMKEVQEEFGVAANTANRAYKLLKDEGLTVAKWGGPTLVASRRSAGSGVARIERLQQTGNEYAPGESSANHSAVLTSLRDPELCRELDVDPGDEVVLRRRIFLRDDVPSVVALSFIQIRAMVAVPEIRQQGPLKPFWHDTYRERTGREIFRSPERRSARLANGDELRAFGIDIPGDVAAAVLVLRTTFHDEEGVISVWEDVYRPGLWQVAKE
jgi:DNA-binding GntR family transcriptional regulator